MNNKMFYTLITIQAIGLVFNLIAMVISLLHLTGQI